MKKLNLAVDFDGVIHKYSKGWQDGSIYDLPIDGALLSLKKLHEDFNIIIFTTRLNPAVEDSDIQNKLITDWLAKYGFEKGKHYDQITGSKPMAQLYLDDRGMKFLNWNESLKEIGNYLVSLKTK
jgi:hypothetical protein